MAGSLLLPFILIGWLIGSCNSIVLVNIYLTKKNKNEKRSIVVRLISRINFSIIIGLFGGFIGIIIGLFFAFTLFTVFSFIIWIGAKIRR